MYTNMLKCFTCLLNDTYRHFNMFEVFHEKQKKSILRVKEVFSSDDEEMNPVNPQEYGETNDGLDCVPNEGENIDPANLQEYGESNNGLDCVLNGGEEMDIANLQKWAFK